MENVEKEDQTDERPCKRQEQMSQPIELSVEERLENALKHQHIDANIYKNSWMHNNKQL